MVSNNNDISQQFLAPEDPEILEISKSVEQLLEKVNLQKKKQKDLKKQKLEKRLRNVGKLAKNFDLLYLHDDILLGIFVTVAEKISNNKEQLSNWKVKGEEWRLKNDKMTSPPEPEEVE
jgi:hypothetical protein